MLKTCKCGGKVSVKDVRNLSKIHPKHEDLLIVKKAQSLGYKEGIVRKRQCDSCERNVTTIETVIEE